MQCPKPLTALRFLHLLLLIAASSVAAMTGTASEVRTVAGNGTDGYSGDGGPAVAAAISQPFGIVISVVRANFDSSRCRSDFTTVRNRNWPGQRFVSLRSRLPCHSSRRPDNQSDHNGRRQWWERIRVGGYRGDGRRTERALRDSV